MAKMKKQQFSGVVYSTDESYRYDSADQSEDVDTLPPDKQRLTVSLDKKARKGKMVSLVRGFVGHEDDLQSLASMLKRKCAVGGSAKDGEIIIQGDFRKRIQEVLVAEGYNVKMLG